jgi:hypothetical protein
MVYKTVCIGLGPGPMLVPRQQLVEGQIPDWALCNNSVYHSAEIQPAFLSMCFLVMFNLKRVCL